MWTAHDVTTLKLKRGTGITLGAFDGVHLGHEALIRRMVTGAEAQGLDPVVITFDPLPGQLLQRDSYKLLSSLEDRLERIASLGVHGTVIMPFDRAFMDTAAGTFVGLLVNRLGMQGLWVGPDFALGKDRTGDVSYLKQVGAEMGFSTHVFEETIRWQGKPVRSSRIREALRVGDIEEANGCLGYPYRLTGDIVHGDRRGRALGFPTANLSASPHRLLPADGVYVCSAHLAEGAFAAITNVGTRPTFDDGGRTVEAYLLDFQATIYGREMHLDFLKRLRPELRFPSVDALIHQMIQDEKDARRWLKSRGETGAPQTQTVERATRE